MRYTRLTQKFHALEHYQPLPIALAQNLEDWLRVELTYTSNALEGNTLTRAETALVLEKKIAVGGKTLREHLEATNHAAALDWARCIVKQMQQKKDELHQLFTEKNILQLHALILKGIDDDNAGRYRSVPVRISGSEVVLPNPRKVPTLMHDFTHWLQQQHASWQKKVKDSSPLPSLHSVELAAEAHYQLVTIHPFVDGNGRTARLLMNLILLLHNYPPAIIYPKDRLAYVNALEQAQLGGSKEDYLCIIAAAVEHSLDIYLAALNGHSTMPEMSVRAPVKTYAANKQQQQLLKIGALAREAQEATSTIRYWTKIGLLEVAATTAAGYQLYAPEMIARIQQLKKLQAQRYTLEEIRRLICIS